MRTESRYYAIGFFSDVESLTGESPVLFKLKKDINEKIFYEKNSENKDGILSLIDSILINNAPTSFYFNDNNEIIGWIPNKTKNNLDKMRNGLHFVTDFKIIEFDSDADAKLWFELEFNL